MSLLPGVRLAFSVYVRGPATLLGVLKGLPGWVIDDSASVREEVAEWKGLSALDCWRLARLCARDAIWAARLGGNLPRVLDHVDPIPDSTVAALARLRSQMNRRHDDR